VTSTQWKVVFGEGTKLTVETSEYKLSTDYNLAFINADTEWTVWTSLVNSLDLTC